MGICTTTADEPWKTQAKVREIAKAEYANEPSGI